MKLEIVQINLVDCTVNYRLVDPDAVATVDTDPTVLRGAIRLPLLNSPKATLEQISDAVETAVLVERVEKAGELRARATKLETEEIRLRRA